jgi:hypothetical protein
MRPIDARPPKLRLVVEVFPVPNLRQRLSQPLVHSTTHIRRVRTPNLLATDNPPLSHQTNRTIWRRCLCARRGVQVDSAPGGHTHRTRRLESRSVNNIAENDVAFHYLIEEVDWSRSAANRRDQNGQRSHPLPRPRSPSGRHLATVLGSASFDATPHARLC